jgi:hypothetical protein
LLSNRNLLTGIHIGELLQMPPLLGNLRGEIVLECLTSASSWPSERVRIVDFLEEGEDALLGDNLGDNLGDRGGIRRGFRSMYR